MSVQAKGGIRYRARGKQARKELTAKPNFLGKLRHRMLHCELQQCNLVFDAGHIRAMYKSNVTVRMKWSSVCWGINRRRLGGFL